MSFETLKRRSEFLAVRGGARWSTPAFLMEGRARKIVPAAGVAAGEAERQAQYPAQYPCQYSPQYSGPRFGFVASRKLGGAVSRNRMRRRLREAIRLAGGEVAQAGWDYVVVVRGGAETLPFEEIVSHVRVALGRIAQGGGRKPAGEPRRHSRQSGNANSRGRNTTERDR